MLSSSLSIDDQLASGWLGILGGTLTVEKFAQRRHFGRLWENFSTVGDNLLSLRNSRNCRVMPEPINDTLIIGLPVARSVVLADVQVRPMLLSDLEDLVWLWFGSYPETLTLATSWEDEVIEWKASLDGAYGQVLEPACLAAEVNGHLVGAIQTVVDAPWPRTPSGPFITELFVAPQWRNRGIATNLVRQALAAAYDLGFTSVGLRVDPDNTAARSLYSSIGFVDWHE